MGLKKLVNFTPYGAAYKGITGNRASDFKPIKGVGDRMDKYANKTIPLAERLFGTQMDNVSEEFAGYDNTLAGLSGMSKDLEKQSNQSYFDTNEGIAATKKIDQQSDKTRDKLRNDSNLMGLSDEAYLAGLGGINESEGMKMATLAGRADQRRTNINQQRNQVLSQLLRGYGNKAAMKGNMFSQAYGNANNAYGQAVQGKQQSVQNISDGLGQLTQLGMMASGVPA